MLRPLAARRIETVAEQGAQWVTEIRRAAEFDEVMEVKLVSLLVQFVAQRFIELPREEIDRMLKLTPFEETVAGKQYIEEGLRQGIEQGIEQGVLVARKDDVLKALQVRFQQTGDLTSQQVGKLTVWSS